MCKSIWNVPQQHSSGHSAWPLTLCTGARGLCKWSAWVLSSALLSLTFNPWNPPLSPSCSSPWSLEPEGEPAVCVCVSAHLLNSWQRATQPSKLKERECVCVCACACGVCVCVVCVCVWGERGRERKSSRWLQTQLVSLKSSGSFLLQRLKSTLHCKTRLFNLQHKSGSCSIRVTHVKHTHTHTHTHTLNNAVNNNYTTKSNGNTQICST